VRRPKSTEYKKSSVSRPFALAPREIKWKQVLISRPLPLNPTLPIENVGTYLLTLE
jgi:hypothetical protein